MRAAILTGLATAVAGCDLTEVITPEAEDLLIVEVVLRPELMRQQMILHRSLVGGRVRPEPDAVVSVRDEISGAEFPFTWTDQIEACVEGFPALPIPVEVSCYLSEESQWNWPVPGRSYTLHVRTPDGGEATGRTRVPADFDLYSFRAVGGVGCRLEPQTAFPLAWSRSEGAWAYLAELDLSNLSVALGESLPGVPDRIRLTGLAISERDTTMVLPSDFGVFQRTLYEPELLLALRDGFPVHTLGRLVVAAVDENYVNAVRGGDFNPSGRVRIASVHGAATGLFGSATARARHFRVAVSGGLPCD